MHRLRFGVVLALVGLSSWFGPHASAGCHSFTVGATSSVMEGGKANVIIERDGSVSDSSVRVQTVNGTATAPGDFTAYDQRVTFTGSQLSKTVTVQTKQDATQEGNEAFTIKVSEGMGCANPSYVYGDPAVVTIKDDDTPAPTTTPVPTTTTVIRTGIPTATPSPSPTPTPSTSPTDSPTPAPTFTPTVVTEDGGFPWVPVLAVVGFLAAGGGALILVRMRRGPAGF